MTIEYRGLKLDPFQEKAIQLVDECKSLIVAAPTGAGKTLIAEYAIEQSLKEGWRIIYTAPIKAISNQKFRDFTCAYGDKVGILTGDVSLNPYAQALIMTTEIFRNTIFDDPERLRDVRYVIFDEVHFMDDEERGTVWEESIIFAPPHVRFICLSATISNLHNFAAWVSHVREDKLEIVEEHERPVPLKHLLFIQGKGIGNIKDLMRLEQSAPKARFGPRNRRELEPEVAQAGPAPAKKMLNWRRALIDHLQETSRLPCLFFCFSRRDCELHAYENMRRDLLTEDESAEINRLLDGLCARYDVADDPAVQEIAKMLKRGVVCHHAGLLPTQKEIIERLFTTGLIKILFATETFAMGVNMPAKTVVFDSLHKFNGVERAYLKSRQYQQMAGRAGRRGMDEIGYVYSHVEWPFVRAGAVERIIYGEPEEVRSQFNLSYSTVLNLYGRLGTGIFKACQKSFAAFLAGQKEKNRRRDRHQPGGARFNGMLDQLHRRINLLVATGFINRGKLTERGTFASRIYGYELHIAQLFFDGIFQRLSAHEINGLLCAVVHESRRWERAGRKRFRDRGFPGPFNRARWAVEHLRSREKAQGITVPAKELDFGLSEAAMAWSEGCDFVELDRYTEAADGDIVRTFRLSIQLARQLARALEGQHDLRSRLDAAVRGMNRDIVDAERLLRMG
jgi:superfamily II RNA helicase